MKKRFFFGGGDVRSKTRKFTNFGQGVKQKPRTVTLKETNSFLRAV